MARDAEFSSEVFKCLKSKFRGKDLGKNTLVCNGQKFHEDHIVNAIKDYFDEMRVDFEVSEPYYAHDSGLAVVCTLFIKVMADNNTMTSVVTVTDVYDDEFHVPDVGMILIRVK